MAVLVALGLAIDLDQLGPALSATKGWLLVLTLGIYFPSTFLRVIRLYLVINKDRFQLSLFRVGVLHFAGGALAFLAPGLVGEIGQSYYGMVSFGMRGGVVSALVADRIAALSTLLLYTALALAISVGWYAAALCAVAAFLLIAVTIWPRVIPWSPLCKLITLVTHRETTRDELVDACRLRGGRAAAIYGLAILGWVFTAVKFVVAAEAVGLGVEPLRVVMALPLVSLVRIVPLTFNGLGTQEATLVILLAGQGGSAAAAAMAIVIRVVNSVPAGVLGIMAIWYLARLGPSQQPTASSTQAEAHEAEDDIDHDEKEPDSSE